MVNLDYLYKPEFAKSLLEKDYFDDKRLGFKVIENGTILSYKRTISDNDPKYGWGFGGIVDSNGNFIRESGVFTGACKPYTPPPESIQHSSETVIYLGMFYSTWGHAITDNIRRLWFLKSEFMKQFKNCPLVYLLCTRRVVDFTLKSDKSFYQMLNVLEVDVDNIRLITEPTQFDKIILPDESFVRDKFTNEYRETIDIIRNFALKNRTPNSSKKFYFFHGSRQHGEERLAEYFKSKGYKTVMPQQRSDFYEEINLLINCESFASTMGSCSHNSVFLRDGTEAIFIPRGVKSIFNPYQEVLNEVNSLNARYIDSTLTLFSLWYNDLFYIVSKQLKSFFGDKCDSYDEVDFKNFLSYIKTPMRNLSTIDPVVKEYYEVILTDFMAQLKRRKDLIASCDMPPNWEYFRPFLNYQTYVHRKGWRDGLKVENEPSNPLDQELEILAININYPHHKIYYSVYFNEAEGWSQEVIAPEVAGTVGVRKPIYGMKLRLDETGAKEFDILYRMHKFDNTWTPWAKNGESLYSHNIKLNAIQIKLEPVKLVEDARKFDYTQAFLTEDDGIYLHGQRQDLTQIKKDVI